MPNKKGELTKIDMERAIAKMLGTNINDTQALLTCVFEYIKGCMRAGEVLNIRNFGNFRVQKIRGKVARVFKHPEKLGREYYYNRVIFRPAEGFKKLVYTGKNYRRKFPGGANGSDKKT